MNPDRVNHVVRHPDHKARPPDRNADIQDVKRDQSEDKQADPVFVLMRDKNIIEQVSLEDRLD